MRKIHDKSMHAMNTAKKKLDSDRNEVTAEMRRFAIHETEKRLNEMRQKHVEELESVTGAAIQSSGVALVHQDDLALQKLQQALEAKRDQLLRDEKERIEASLNLELAAMAAQHESLRKGYENDAEHYARAELQSRLAAKEREVRLALAMEDTAKSLQERISEINADNQKETQRVFGELQLALEVGAKNNIDLLAENLTSQREEKVANLTAHSESVVSEAMESLAAELLDAERLELHDLKLKSERNRLELVTKTRLEGVEAVAREVDYEKQRLRERKELMVSELRAHLEGAANSDLSELEDALQSDLEMAENLMLDSVKSGLAGSLQQAREEHATGFPVDEKALEKLQNRLRARHVKIVTEVSGASEASESEQQAKRPALTHSCSPAAEIH